MRASRLITLACVVMSWFFAVSCVRAEATFNFEAVGGIILAPDQATLIVAVPSQAKLIYFDSKAEKELKQVELDFQPTLLATQGKKLFVAAKGTAKILVLDSATAKVQKEIQLDGEPLSAISCHAAKGLLYAVNLNHEVFSIDPETGKSEKTQAKGQHLIVDPSGGKYLYTAIQKSIQETLLFEELGGNKVKLSLVLSGARALMLKYAIEDMDLKLIEANDNAAINGRGMAVSPDGKRIAMAGGGGWRSKTDQRANYAIAVFNTAKLNNLEGQIATGPYPNNIAFHPVLNLGAAYNSTELILFNAKSFVKRHAFKPSEKSFNHSGYLLFGGQGTKLIYCSYSGNNTKASVLQFFDLPLTPDEQAKLKRGEEKKE